MSNRQLYLIDRGSVSEIDVSDLAYIAESKPYMRERIVAYTGTEALYCAMSYNRKSYNPERVVAYTETKQQALYCAKLYYNKLLDADNTNTVIDGETYIVLTLPRISLRDFENRPDHDNVRGTLYVDRRNGEAWIDYHRAVYRGQLHAEASKQLLTCDLPVNCTVTELEAMLHDLRHQIVAVALSHDRETAVERERTLRDSAADIRAELDDFKR